MTRIPTAELIDRLTADAKAVKPLSPPSKRATAVLAASVVAGALAVWLAGDVPGLLRRYAGRELLMAAEMTAMFATAATALFAAFVLSVPGSSARWRVAPLPFFLLWFALSGAGCVIATTKAAAEHSQDCLLFIVGAGLAIGLPLLWQLSRARPIDPLPVALLGGLAAASLSAFLLQFFHPFALTLIDLGVHLVAVLLVLALAGLARRPMLRAA